MTASMLMLSRQVGIIYITVHISHGHGDIVRGGGMVAGIAVGMVAGTTHGIIRGTVPVIGIILLIGDRRTMALRHGLSTVPAYITVRH